MVLVPDAGRPYSTQVITVVAGKPFKLPPRLVLKPKRERSPTPPAANEAPVRPTRLTRSTKAPVALASQARVVPSIPALAVPAAPVPLMTPQQQLAALAQGLQTRMLLAPPPLSVAQQVGVNAALQILQALGRQGQQQQQRQGKAAAAHVDKRREETNSRKRPRRPSNTTTLDGSHQQLPSSDVTDPGQAAGESEEGDGTGLLRPQAHLLERSNAQLAAAGGGGSHGASVLLQVASASAFSPFKRQAVGRTALASKTAGHRDNRHVAPTSALLSAIQTSGGGF